jgi:hypothetical protein
MLERCHFSFDRIGRSEESKLRRSDITESGKKIVKNGEDIYVLYYIISM